MAGGDLRFDGSAVTVEHASARGRILRNTGDFTRGSQLIGTQLFMFLAGAKVPLLIWLAVFVPVFATTLAMTMGNSEIQLCAWRLYSSVWGWLEFDALKPMNLKMPDGNIRRTAMGYIPLVPAVQVAWAKAIDALLGSLFTSVLLSLPLIWWFISAASTRGSSILRERHERGALLVEREILLADILAYNNREFVSASASLFPGLSSEAVRQLPFTARKTAGLHHPYNLAGIPYPYGLEQSHTVVVGTTGAGKTTQLLDLVRQMRARRDNAVIFDLTGAFVEAFYDPERDVIMNPNDERCPSWSIFDDCTTQTEFTAAAQALVPNDGGNADPFWAMAARTLFVEMCVKLQASGQGTNQALSDYLMTADLKNVHRILRDTIADPITAPEAARMAESIRAVFNTNAQAIRFLPTGGKRFSISEWMRRADKPGAILFITARHVDMPMNKALLTLWMDLAIHTLMTLPRTRVLRTWFIFDELGALHRLPAIENGLQTARGFGGAMVLGLHSFARLAAIYGREGAENLTSLARSKLILATADRKTAEACAEFIGNREVRQMDEAHSYGPNKLRDASTLTPRKQVEPLVIADDITNLPALHGFIKFPDGFPAARIKLAWHDYPKIAPGFVIRPPQPLRPKPPAPPFDCAEEGRTMAAQREVSPSEPTAATARQALALKRALGMVGAPRETSSVNEPGPLNVNDAIVADDAADRGQADLPGVVRHPERDTAMKVSSSVVSPPVSTSKTPHLDQSLRELSQDMGDFEAGGEGSLELD